LLEIRFTRQARDRCAAVARGLPDEWVCDAIANGREVRLAGSPGGAGRVSRFERSITPPSRGGDAPKATLAVVGRKVERGWLALTAYLVSGEPGP
jgi:hypothetical protein